MATVAAISSTTQQQLSKALYRQLMRNAKSMKDYNFRSYAIRRIKIGFTENRNLDSPEAFKAVYEDGTKQLEMLKRQAICSQLYPTGLSVME